MKYWIHPEGEDELGDAATYYSTHASPAIAEAFLAEYEHVLELLGANHELGQVAEHGLVCSISRAFPTR